MCEMRVVAAMFPGPDEASAARDILQQLNLTGDELGVAPFAPLSRGESEGVLLAGRFHEDAIPRVTQIVESAGGAVVANVDERWTGLRPARTRPARARLAPDLVERLRRSGHLRN